MLVWLLLENTCEASANNIFIAQNGGGTGSSCEDAQSASFFNTPANWGTAATQIGPATTVHLCGTITTSLVAQSSGLPGNPITIWFEANAKLSQPVCPNSGCLKVSGRSFIVVDGGTNGIVESTANGTGLANHLISTGIEALPCNNCEFRNLTIQNLYVMIPPQDTFSAAGQVNCIRFSGSAVRVYNNTMHDAGFCIYERYGAADNDIQVYNNNLYNIDHGFIFAGTNSAVASNIRFYNNHVHDYANWDDTAGGNHHDGVHAFGVTNARATDVWIYNNLFDGDTGSHPTAHVFFEYAGSSTPWTDTLGFAKIFNNVFMTSNAVTPIGGMLRYSGGTGGQIFNNTLIGIAGIGETCVRLDATTDVSFQNNVMTNCDHPLLIGASGRVVFGAGSIDYNVYGPAATTSGWYFNVFADTFVRWQAICACDAHGVKTSLTRLNSTGTPQSTSAVIGAGANLAGLAISPLNSDKAGVPRPATGAWDAGAFQFAKVPTAVYTMPANGGVSFLTTGTASDPALNVAHAVIRQDAGTLSGIAILGLRINGILISEAGVPASSEVTSGRLYAEVQGSVNTGLAVSNPTGQDASISFYFTNADGTDFGSGSFMLPANQQVAAFLNQAPFNGPTDIQGSFTFTSSIPVGVTALRGLTNERGEFLVTTVPVATLGSVQGPLILPYFADGAGWTTEVILTNGSDVPQSGTVRFFGQGSGDQQAPMLNMTINGSSSSTFSYSIPSHSAVRLVTSGEGTTAQVGSVQITPAGDASTAGVAIFSFRRNGTVVSEASVSVLPLGSTFRTYAESSGSVQSGLAITNPSSNSITVSIELTNLDGTAANVPATVINIPPGGQIAKFINELVPELNVPFQGIARLSASSTVAVTALRSRYNERGDFLISATPPLNEATTLPVSDLIFPHIASGQGYSTQLILFGDAGPGKLYLFSQDGLLKDSSSLAAAVN